MTSSESMDHITASLDDVLITADLARRPRRSPDYAAEGRSLTALAEAMADSAPDDPAETGGDSAQLVPSRLGWNQHL